MLPFDAPVGIRTHNLSAVISGGEAGDVPGTTYRCPWDYK